MRIILQSETYRRSSEPLPENQADTRFYSRYYPRRMMAEVLLDALSQVTGAPTAFPDYPAGRRAMQLPDANVNSYFLKSFGRPARLATCECERTAEPSMVQVLHLSNGDTVNQKLETAGNRIDQLIAAGMSDDKLIEEVYLAAIARHPAEAERQRLLKTLADHRRAEPAAADRRLVLGHPDQQGILVQSVTRIAEFCSGESMAGTRYAMLSAVLIVSALLTTSAPAADPPTYNDQIAPLFKKYCNGCHNAEDREGELVLARYDQVLAGGEHGAVIVAGDSERSRMMQLLTGKAKPVMPPEDNERPTADEIALLGGLDQRRRQGAGRGRARSDAAASRPRSRSAAWWSSRSRPPLAGRPTARSSWRAMAVSKSSGTDRKFDGLRGRANAVGFSRDGALVVGSRRRARVVRRIENLELRRPARSCRRCADTRTVSTPPPSAPTASCWPPAATINKSSCGTRPAAKNSKRSAATTMPCSIWRFGPTAAYWPAPAATAPSSCGTSPAASGSIRSANRSKTCTASLSAPTASTSSPAASTIGFACGKSAPRPRKTPTRLVYSRFAHEGAIIKLAYSPDGRWLVSAGRGPHGQSLDRRRPGRTVCAGTPVRLDPGHRHQSRQSHAVGRPIGRDPGQLRIGHRQSPAKTSQYDPPGNPVVSALWLPADRLMPPLSCDRRHLLVAGVLAEAEAHRRRPSPSWPASRCGLKRGAGAPDPVRQSLSTQAESKPIRTSWPPRSSPRRPSRSKSSSRPPPIWPGAATKSGPQVRRERAAIWPSI